MTAPAGYFDLVREMKNAYNHRLRLVESAKQRGIKPTARAVRHHRPNGSQMASPLSAGGPFRPEGTLPRSSSAVSENPYPRTQLIELRKTLPTFGARRLIREFDLPISHGALERIWRTRA